MRNSRGSSTDGSDSEESDLEKAELDALLDELSDSQSNLSGDDGEHQGNDDEIPTQRSTRQKRRVQKPEWTQRKYETILSTIAILYVACCIMKVPVMNMDFIRSEAL